MSLNHAVKKITAVVVTGGSSGIGNTFIGQLSSLNREIWFGNISRTKPDEEFCKNLNISHFSCDLSASGELERIFPEVEAALDKNVRDGEILLINNAGFGCYGPAQELDFSRQLQMLDLNVRALVNLTGLMLPKMLKHGGVILDVSSTASFQPTPQLSAYGATKAFVTHWNLSLGDDLRGTKVRTLCLCPGPTATNFFKAAGFDEPPVAGYGQTSEEVVSETLKALDKGKRLLVTGLPNKFMAAMGPRFLSKTLLTRISGCVLRKVREQ